MTPEERADLIMFAEGVYQNLVNVICTCVMYGLYMLAFLTALYMFWSPIGARTKALLMPLGIVFFCITWDWISRTDSPLLIIHRAFIHPSNTTNLSVNLSNARNSPNTFETFAWWGPTINLLIGDGLVLWRAWCIWDVRNKRNRFWLGFILILLMVGNIAVNIADAILDTIAPFSLSSGANMIDWVSLVVSLIVNVFATLLVGLKAWHLYQLKHLHHPTEAQYFQINNILLILVESGLVFCLIQILYAVLNGLEVGNENLLSTISLVYSMIIAFANGCAALYPVALVIIIHMEVSPLISLHTSESGACPEFTTIGIEMQDMTPTS
ncbi:hypothetical protein BT96DRAFT_407588 [Gymnopus androsaceus JB14]|uniref:Uncharacterized protein n=1 Tax=Gymnopus androsaceus JB14 TaxID=1447944 RepID=A0A6A4GTV5_9AGAR|nr:hypothetical protein BT96DRAFT_407588 [Gymnopus androsaceus JB14]